MIHDYLTEPFFSPEQNQYLIDTVIRAEGWKPMFEDYLSSGTQSIEGEFSDNGILLPTYIPSWRNNLPWQPLNGIGDFILGTYLKRSKWEYNDVVRHRYMWNYYSASSTCIPHQDRSLRPIEEWENPQFASAVYYLNTNDGYTEIEGVKIPSVSGTFVCFDSMDWHSATADPKPGQRRFTFNIMFEYQDKRLKDGSDSE